MKDEKAISALNEGQNRVESMVLIHQNLYKDDGNPVVNMRKYIPSLVNQIFNSYNISGGRLRVEFEIDDISLEVETVIPIGLVLNELISNALKYAFPNSEHGIVSIRLVMESNGLLLSVADNGVGINDEMIETGFGTKIIRSFARKLEGQLSIKNDQGTSVELLIKNYVRA
jgi:two-component sensor histidine kinase